MRDIVVFVWIFSSSLVMWVFTVVTLHIAEFPLVRHVIHLLGPPPHRESVQCCLLSLPACHPSIVHAEVVPADCNIQHLFLSVSFAHFNLPASTVPAPSFSTFSPIPVLEFPFFD